MTAPNLHLELVHDPHRNRAVLAWSADPLLLRLAIRRVIAEAESRAEQFTGIDDVHAAQEHAEAERLRRALALVAPGAAGS